LDNSIGEYSSELDRNWTEIGQRIGSWKRQGKEQDEGQEQVRKDWNRGTGVQKWIVVYRIGYSGKFWGIERDFGVVVFGLEKVAASRNRNRMEQ
jgi:hypothetical protein